MLPRLEFASRQDLGAAQTSLAGLSVGNPQRSISRPTAERLLEAFQDLTLTILREGRGQPYHLTPL
jgi:hypothetical protein